MTPPFKPDPDPLSILAKLASQERELLQRPVLAPVMAGGHVRVRVSAIVYQMEIEDRSFQGWAILQMFAPGRARVTGVPTPSQISAYLKLLPRLRLVVLGQDNNMWWAMAAQIPDRRFSLERPVPVLLSDRAAPFETICARFDRSVFWFESIDRRRDPGSPER